MGEGAVGVGAGLILLEHYVFLPSTLPPSLGRRAFTAIVAMVMPRAPPQLSGLWSLPWWPPHPTSFMKQCALHK